MPLIRPSSDLADGLEPTAVFSSAAAVPVAVAWSMVVAGVYPGWHGWVGAGRVLYRVLTHHPAEARLRLI